MPSTLKLSFLVPWIATAVTAPGHSLTIDSVTPSVVKSDGSTEITIRGSGFIEGSTIAGIGRKPVRSLTVVGEDTLRCFAPSLPPDDPEPGPRDLVVIDLDTSEEARLPAAVTYVIAMGIRSVSPSEVSYLGKTPITVSGQGFSESVGLAIDGAAVPLEWLLFHSDTLVQALATPHAPTDSPVGIRITDGAGDEAALDAALSYIGPLSVAGVLPGSVAVGEPGPREVRGVGFTPQTAVEIGGQRLSPVSVSFIDARTLSVQVPDLAAGVYDIAVLDVDGEAEVRAMLPGALTYRQFAAGDPSFRLSFESPRFVGGETVAGLVLDESRGVAPGISGYSLSIAVEGDCEVGGGSTAGTVGAPVEEGGLFQGGFQLTELVDSPAGRGIVHALVFSLGQPVVLDPLAAPYRLFEVHVRPGAAGCGGCRLELRDGLPGPGGPVTNAITYREAPFAAELTPAVELDCPDVHKPGDANHDGGLDISDALALLELLFLDIGRELPCGGFVLSEGSSSMAILDANGDVRVDLSDAVSLLGFLFLGGPAHVLGTACVELPDCRPGPFCKS